MIGRKSVLNNERFHVDAVSVDFPNLPLSRFTQIGRGVKQHSKVSLETCAAAVTRRESYSQLELVVSRFLPSVNLAREMGNY